MADTDLIARQLLSDLKRDFGLTDEQAAGVVGNLMHESAGFQTLQEVNPTVPGSAGGFGFAQWTGDRRKDFDRYVEDAGLDRNSYAANYGFLKHELENNRYERNQFNKVKKADTAAEAAKIVSENYLRPGIPHNSSRVRYAEQALSYADMPVPPAEIPNTVGTALSTVPTPPRTVMAPRPVQQPRQVQNQRDQNAALNDRLAAAEPDPAPTNLTAPGAINAMFANLPRLPSSLPSVPGASDRVRGNEQQTRNNATTIATIPSRPQTSASDMTRGRSGISTIATYPTKAPPSVSDMMRGRNGYQTIASIPSTPQPMSGASDRVRGSNGYKTIATIPSTPVGQPPATRMVQSVPVPTRPSIPQSYAGQEAAPRPQTPQQQYTRAAAFSGGSQSPFVSNFVPPITTLPTLPPIDGFDVANKDQSRLVAGQYPMAPGGEIPTAAPFAQMPPMPFARPSRSMALPPMPQARPQYAQPQQRRSLISMPSLLSPAQSQPARVVVQASPINTNNHSPAQLEALREGRSYFTASDNGVQPVRAMNGKLVNNY